MPGRGVLLGDVSRANDQWNERIGAAGAGAGLETETAGQPANLPARMARAMADDLFDAAESKLVMSDLVFNYTTMTGGEIGSILLSMAAHALAIGVLTERQRWEDAPAPEMDHRTTDESKALEVIVAWLRERDDEHRFEDTLPSEETCRQEAANLLGALWDAAAE